MTRHEQAEILGENLRELIQKSGKQQKDIAIDLDVPLTTFNTWCVGKIVPRFDKICQLAEYFGCRVSDLTDEHMPNHRELRDLEILIEGKSNDEQFLKRMLAYAKLLSENPEA